MVKPLREDRKALNALLGSNTDKHSTHKIWNTNKKNFQGYMRV